MKKKTIINYRHEGENVYTLIHVKLLGLSIEF